MNFPQEGKEINTVLALLNDKRTNDAKWDEGNLFGYVYHVSESIHELINKVYEDFGMTNALNPMAFPSLQACESEVLSMSASLLGNPDAVGTITTGGTESICMAMKAARDWARSEKDITKPNVIVPTTVHPAFQKAGHYFDIEVRVASVGPDFRVSLKEIENQLDDNTMMLVGSAPNFPYGTIDPIEEIGQIALKAKTLFHVDGCLGGFMLPFLKRLEYPLPPFDLSVPGVTSMSADLHKYGYSAKGASAVLYNSRDLRKKQFYVYTEWPGGLYGSPSMTGARGGAPIASAWALLQHLGESGYMKLARHTNEAADQIKKAIDTMDDLYILGKPAMNVFAFGSDTVDVYALCDVLAKKGWVLDKLQKPNALHMMISPIHVKKADSFSQDLQAALKTVKEGNIQVEGQAAMYGALTQMPDRGDVKNIILEFLDGLY
ncbi:MAG: aspartate aminotransferase family protein [Myxococcota bacterium]|jgi:glutamate/tyrosine decarboxylase-like PLP-dependent enzyme|nr:aspartate aminotransferase family protein [Myxococcota bacterium]